MYSWIKVLYSREQRWQRFRIEEQGNMVGHSIGTRERIPAGKAATFYSMPNFWGQELGTESLSWHT